MGNTVGSANTDFCNLIKKEGIAYITGLLCADGYHRTSSIGLSNTDVDLIEHFARFFGTLFSKGRLKQRIYRPDRKLRRTTAYHIYVNSRPLLRQFQVWKRNGVEFENANATLQYFAGRFDGDGSVAKDFYRDCRIVYGTREEAERDANLLKQIGFKKISVYRYKKARTYCLYVSRYEATRFLEKLYPYSMRLQKSVFAPRRDLNGKTIRSSVVTELKRRSPTSV